MEIKQLDQSTDFNVNFKETLDPVITIFGTITAPNLFTSNGTWHLGVQNNYANVYLKLT